MSSEKPSLKFPDAETVLEKDDYQEMDSVDELKETLETETGKELSVKEAYQKASDEWWKLNRCFVDPEKPEELPSDTVNVAGTDFHVHGIVHGSLNYVNAERISTDVAEHVMSSIDNWEDERKHIYMEENLTPIPFILGKPEKETYYRLNDIGDIEAFGEKAEIAIDSEPLSGLERLKKKAKYGLKHRAGHLLSKALKLQENEDNPIPRDADEYSTLKLATKDPKYIKDLQNAERAAILPLKLERSYGLNNNHHGLFHAERSIYQANYAVSDALKHPGQNAHIVVGAAHHPQIVDRLESLSERWDIHQLEPEWDTSLEE